MVLFRARQIVHLLLITIIISACSTHNLSKKLLHKIDRDIEKHYRIHNGHLIALYNLTNTHSQLLYNKDFYLIINDSSHNQRFLAKLHTSYSKAQIISLINQQVALQSNKLQKLLSNLDNQYHFLSKMEFHTTSNIPHHSYDIFSNIEHRKENLSLDRLYKLDNIAQTIPLLTAMQKPKITSHYGMRKHPLTHQMKFHQGIDLVSNKSAPIYSAANGKVSKVSRVAGYGNMIEINHSHGFSSRYAHLSKIYVKDGENIIRGQRIGLQGKSGNVTKEHLHYEVLLQNKQINPLEFIPEIIN